MRIFRGANKRVAWQMNKVVTHLVENHQRRLESTTGTKFAAFDINAILA